MPEIPAGVRKALSISGDSDALSFHDGGVEGKSGEVESAYACEEQEVRPIRFARRGWAV